MAMTSSPLMHPAPHHHSHSHSPLNLSPAGSPILRPLTSSKPKSNTASPAASGSITPLGPLPPPRSYARAPTQRPYQSPLIARSSNGGGGRVIKEVERDTLRFGEEVAHLVERRTRESRKGTVQKDLEGAASADGEEQGLRARKGRSLGGSLAGSWEMERAELIVDVPVWSPGCFQDLSTLHALRDTTLSHTHSILAYLLRQHSIPASYRLLARSAVTGNSGGVQVGWGCIRLAPSVTSPIQSHSPLRPTVRRASFVHEPQHARRSSTGLRPNLPKAMASSPVVDGAHIQMELPAKLGANALGLATRVPPVLAAEQAVVDDDDDLDSPVRLREGYRSGSASDDEEEEEVADVLVAREVEKRGAKEGDAFLMTLFGGPALILL